MYMYIMLKTIAHSHSFTANLLNFSYKFVSIDLVISMIDHDNLLNMQWMNAFAAYD